MAHHYTLFAGLFALSLSASAADSLPSTLSWYSSTALEWRCPQGQDCAGKVDYRALYAKEGGQQVYLSLRGGEAPAVLDAATLNAAFRNGDLYWGTATGVISIDLQADGSGEGKVRFLPAPAGHLKAVLEAKRYRLTVDRMGGSECRLGDVAGLCRDEKIVNKHLRITLDFPLPPSAP